MRQILNFCVFLLVFATCLGCSQKEPLASTSVAWQDQKIEINVTRTRAFEHHTQPALFVYAQVNLESVAEKWGAINLTCLEASFGQTTSEKIQLDRYYSVLPDGINFSKNDDAIKVYWIFPRDFNVDKIGNEPFVVQVREGCKLLESAANVDSKNI